MSTSLADNHLGSEAQAPVEVAAINSLLDTLPEMPGPC